jgi:IS30 family transposase
MEQKKYTQIKKAERLEIAILLNKQYSLREIAKALGRSVSSLSDEIQRNLVNGTYDPLKANHKAYVRRKYAKYQGKAINENKGLKEYIELRLRQGWSPEVISGRMRLEKQSFYASKTAIYEYLYSSYGQVLCPYLYSKRYIKRKRKHQKTKKSLIPNRIGIEQRPKIVALNREYGHYEGDTIVSGKKTRSKAALVVIYERKAKYVDMRKISNLKPENNNKAVLEMQQSLKILSYTLDNGIENIKHEELGVLTFFCDPYSAWQKGGVENVNHLIRRFIPKGLDINQYSDTYIQTIVQRLNNTPRKSLNYQTPLEVMIENNQFKSFAKSDKFVNLKLGNLDVKKEAECSA